MTNAYEASGVDVKRGYEAVERMKKHVDSTNRKGVLGGLGSFGGLFQLDSSKYEEPVLVSGTDGVGTKILLAQQAEKYDTIGIDCVAMCVNDILSQGAEPLFFLDYLAVGHNDPAMIEQIVAGVADGCRQSNMALVGGETAEMPDLYANKDFDLAGFSVGVIDKAQIIDGSNVQDGDVIVGIPSSGIHSNGYSLVRKIFFKDNDWTLDKELPNGKKLVDELLEPTRIYVKDVLPLVEKNIIKSMGHITGGGFNENLPRMLSDQLVAKIDTNSFETPEIFNIMQELAGIPAAEMYEIFNMGIGFVLAVSKDDVEVVTDAISDAVVIGEVNDRKDGQEEAIILEGFGDEKVD